MSPAKYQDFQPESIVERNHPQQGLLRVIAGSVEVEDQTIPGPLTDTGVPATVVDWRAEAGKTSASTHRPTLMPCCTSIVGA